MPTQRRNDPTDLSDLELLDEDDDISFPLTTAARTCKRGTR
jgi:hypothetical protein